MNITEVRPLSVRDFGCFSYSSDDAFKRTSDIKKPLSIVIAGPQPLLRLSVNQIVDSFGIDVDVRQTISLNKVDLAESGGEFINILVLFKHVGDRDFYQRLELFKEKHTGKAFKVVVFSDVLGDSDWLRMDREVVDLFLPMKVDHDVAKEVLRKMILNPSDKDVDYKKLTSSFCDKFMPDITDLSKKELQVMSFLQHGLCNKMIAWELNVSEYTVKSYMSSIYRKLKSAGRINMAVLATRQIPFVSGLNRV